MGILDFLSSFFGKPKPKKRRVATSQTQSKSSNDMVQLSKNDFDALMRKINQLEKKISEQNKEIPSPIPQSQDAKITPHNLPSENLIKQVEIAKTSAPQKTSSAPQIDGVILDRENKEFIRAWQIIEKTNDSIFLTGKAGTGKTTFLKFLKEKTKKKHIVLAPTGVAAVNAGGVTIHSFFQLDFGSPYMPNDTRLKREHLRLYKNKIQIIESLETIIIDEISMVRADILEVISQILQIFRKNSKPFGGIQMVFIGDVFQLSPVSDNIFTELEEYTSPFFFDAPCLQRTKYHIIELQKIYRQKDFKFIYLLNKIRENNPDDQTFQLLNSRYTQNMLSSDAFKKAITLTARKDQADEVNLFKLQQLDGQEYVFNGIFSGKYSPKEALVDVELRLKVGAQVMIAKNNFKEQPYYYNGSMGIIESIEEMEVPKTQEDGSILTAIENLIRVRLFENNEIVNISVYTWEKYEYKKERGQIISHVIGKYSQLPVRLAWAMTIHKSQGLTFDNVIIDADKAFAHGQVYVALSRCRSLNGLILKKPIPAHAIKVEQRVIDFMKNNKL